MYSALGYDGCPNMNITVLEACNDFSIFQNFVPDLFKNYVLNICFNDYEDMLIWEPAVYGKFSTGSAYELIRNKNQEINLFKFIWHNCIPSKFYFLTWRILCNAIPIDSLLQKKGINLASRKVLSHVFWLGRFGIHLHESFLLIWIFLPIIFN